MAAQCPVPTGHPPNGRDKAHASPVVFSSGSRSGWLASHSAVCLVGWLVSECVVFTSRSATQKVTRAAFTHFRVFQERTLCLPVKIPEASEHRGTPKGDSHHPSVQIDHVPRAGPTGGSLSPSLPFPPLRSIRNASLHLRQRPTSARTIRHLNWKGRSKSMFADDIIA